MYDIQVHARAHCLCLVRGWFQIWFRNGNAHTHSQIEWNPDSGRKWNDELKSIGNYSLSNLIANYCAVQLWDAHWKSKNREIKIVDCSVGSLVATRINGGIHFTYNPLYANFKQQTHVNDRWHGTSLLWCHRFLCFSYNYIISLSIFNFVHFWSTPCWVETSETQQQRWEQSFCQFGNSFQLYSVLCVSNTLEALNAAQARTPHTRPSVCCVCSNNKENKNLVSFTLRLLRHANIRRFLFLTIWLVDIAPENEECHDMLADVCAFGAEYS